MGKSFDFLLTAAALIAGILLLTGHGDFYSKEEMQNSAKRNTMKPR